MSEGLRWRIVSLQVVLVLVLAFCAGFLFWGSGFINGMVHDQLVAQRIGLTVAMFATLVFEVPVAPRTAEAPRRQPLPA